MAGSPNDNEFQQSSASGQEATEATSRPTATSRGRYLVALAGILAICALLVACSSGTSNSGGINFSLGLAGSTADHANKPPTIAANGPSGSYAFVYDNQIWLRQDGETQARQLTHMVLSNGSSIAWGPLVWSPDGRFIAFTVAENLNLTAGGSSRTSGPLYYLDTTTDPPMLYTSAGTGSIYGHSYTWFGNSFLVYANGSGIQMFGVGDTDPRAWQVVGIPDGTGNSGQADYTAFSDLQISGENLYYTRADIRSPGGVGVVGSATLISSHIGAPGDYVAPTPTPSPITQLLPLADAQQIASLGQVYAASGGAFVAGEWQIHGSQLAVQRIQHVDVTAGTVTSQLCILPVSAQNASGCDTSILDEAKTQPIAARPQLAFSGANKIAYNADGFYLSGVSGRFASSGWPVPPAWAPDGEVAMTQIVSSKTDASGIVRTATNVVLIGAGGQGTVLIEGAQNIAWRPGQ